MDEPRDPHLFIKAARSIILLLPPGSDASLSEVTPPNILSGCPYNSPVSIYTLGWREALRELNALPRTQNNDPGRGSYPERSICANH